MLLDFRKSFRLRKTKLAVFGFFCVTAWLLYPLLLQELAMLAITDNSRPDSGYLVLYSEEVGENFHACYNAAAAAYREDPRRRILLIEPEPHTLEKYGIMPSFSAISRRELAAEGVPETAIEKISGIAPDVWRATRLLGKWLENHPQAEVTCYIDRFQSRRLSCIHKQVIAPELAVRISIFAVPVSQCDETNWWKSRGGVKAFAFAHLSLIYARFYGEPDVFQSSWNPDDYARALDRP